MQQYLKETNNFQAGLDQCHQDKFFMNRAYWLHHAQLRLAKQHFLFVTIDFIVLIHHRYPLHLLLDIQQEHLNHLFKTRGQAIARHFLCTFRWFHRSSAPLLSAVYPSFSFFYFTFFLEIIIICHGNLIKYYNISMQQIF